MRGDDQQQAAMFRDISPEARVPDDHALRAIRVMVEVVLKELSPQLDHLYAQIGQPSIAPETLLRALLRQVLYTVRRERLLMEQLDYNVLCRWCVGLNVDDPVWDPTTLIKSRECWLETSRQRFSSTSWPSPASVSCGRMHIVPWMAR